MQDTAGEARTSPYGRAKAGQPARTYIQQLYKVTGCSPEDLQETMNDREKWRERVRDIRASGTTRWWWWWLPPFFFSRPRCYILTPDRRKCQMCKRCNCRTHLYNNRKISGSSHMVEQECVGVVKWYMQMPTWDTVSLHSQSCNRKRLQSITESTSE